MGLHCIVTAAARLAKESPEQFVKRLSHDGSKTYPDSDVVRTHHIQEIIDGLLDRGVALCPIQLMPTAVVSPDLLSEGDSRTPKGYVVYFGDGTVSGNFDRFKSHLKGNEGIITGMLGPTGHAVYFDGEYCHDSRGRWQLWVAEFDPSEFWRAVWT